MIRSERAEEMPVCLQWREQVVPYNINQINSSQQVMENLNILQSENLLVEDQDSHCLLVPIEKTEENLSIPASQEKIKKGYQNRKKKRFNKSLWTLQENMKYVRFLQQNRDLFTSTKENRRFLKINKMISLCIGTRSPDQCRSHHQKMVKYHESIEGIINHVYLLHTMFVEDPDRRNEKQGKMPMRIRKRVNKNEQESVTLQEEGEKTLWDVLCINQEELVPSEQNLLYL